ncbi:hypothetical protein [Actinomyces oris]|uniref:Lipoprotein n=1 Tax=Actinomyces oris TaxID=544580 RepID=A0A1Q8VYH1_9ACTO|nr:hypothetical protein [Actinomyces oris]OLL14733.1 hypothetical protein BKH32_06810 [Actinomyces oris]OLO53445.1 hypothetical protein BKH30_05150 [Actinomyces oris]
MRRRIFLTAALGATAGAGALSLSGCASIKQRIARTLIPQPPTVLHASLSTPPEATAIPTNFGSEAVWPLRVKENQNHPWPTNAMVETTRGSFLIAYDVNSDDDTAGLSGDRPIIVDLKGPTTYTLVPDDSEHGYRIEPMTVPQVGGVPGGNRIAPGTLITEQFTSAAACDDEFAYLITGREDVVNERPENRGRVSLLKIRLADRRIVASTLIGENLALKARASTYRAGSSMTLTSDGASLLITSTVPHRALRLSTKDLSVQFDLDSVTSQRFCAVDGGEAVALLSDDEKVHTAIVTLADGVTHPIENVSAQLVHQGYLYAVDSRAKEPPYPEVCINLATGERTELTDLPVDKEDKHASLTASNGYVIRKTDYIQVRKNGSATAMLTRKSTEKESYKSAAIYGSILYLALNGGRLRLINLDTGAVILESPTGGQHEMVTVTPYGFSNEGAFYPATAWKS